MDDAPLEGAEQAAGTEQTAGGGEATQASAPAAAQRAPGASVPVKRKPGRPAVFSGCQVCGASLVDQKSFYQRYHICDAHMMAPSVDWKGIPQRFCQQCGRFHSLDAFAPAMRSCRKQLAKHAERRRRGRELAAAAAAAAATGASGDAAAAGAASGSPAPRLLPPASKRQRPPAASEGTRAELPAVRSLGQGAGNWRLADSSGSGGSSAMHQSAPEWGLDALLAAAAEEEGEGSSEDEQEQAEEEQQGAARARAGKRSRLEPDLSWFAPAAAAPLQPSSLAASVAAGTDAAGSTSPMLASGSDRPADAVALAAPQQLQQAPQQLAMWMQQQQQQQQDPMLPLAPAPGMPAFAAMLQALLHPAPQPQGPTAALLALMQQASGQQHAAAVAAAMQQAVLHQSLMQQLQALTGAATLPAALPALPPVAAQSVNLHQVQRDRHVSALFESAVDGLLLGILKAHSHASPPQPPK